MTELLNMAAIHPYVLDLERDIFKFKQTNPVQRQIKSEIKGNNKLKITVDLAY